MRWTRRWEESGGRKKGRSTARTEDRGDGRKEDGGRKEGIGRVLVLLLRGYW